MQPTPTSVVALVLALASSSAVAEGSINFAPAGTTNNRAFLEVGPDTYNLSGIRRKTTLYAYANSGEKILLGSSAAGVGSSDIKVTSPGGTVTSCGSAGLISKRVNERAGPLLAGTSVPNGYTPCTYNVSASGIYQIEFLAPTTGGGNPPTTGADLDWPTPGTANTWIAAWDVTVVSGTTTQTKKTGRVFAKYFAMNVGSNNSANAAINVYPLTKDGYVYSLALNFDPFGFIFYANNVGNLTTAGTSAYRTAAINNPQHSPASSDTATYVTHKLFLNEPDSSMPATASAPSGLDNWLLRAAPVAPPQPTNLSFTGAEGTPGQAGGGIGGTFSFDNPGSSPAPYRIIMAFKTPTNGVNSDRILVGTAQAGTNTVTWDGKDGDGKDVVPNSTAYTVRAYLAAGEIHFPLIDSENLTDLTVRRLKNVDSDAAVVYWDDRSVTASGTAPSPQNALGGIDSAGSATHAYSANWGNDLVVDTWAYYPGTAADFASGIKVSEADVQVAKTYVSGGSTTSPALFDVVVRNASTTTTARNVRVTDAVPSGVAGMTWSCPGCTTTSGTGAVDTLATLAPGASVTVRVTATLSSSSVKGTAISNTAAATRGADAPDPNTANNSATASFTAFGTPQVQLTKTVRNVTLSGKAGESSTAFPGNVLEYVITFSNAGNENARQLVVRDTLLSTLVPASTGTLVCAAGAAGTSFNVTSSNVEVNVGAACGDLVPGAQGTVTVRATVK